jgi:hypothetical protein
MRKTKIIGRVESLPLGSWQNRNEEKLQNLLSFLCIIIACIREISAKRTGSGTA